MIYKVYTTYKVCFISDKIFNLKFNKIALELKYKNLVHFTQIMLKYILIFINLPIILMILIIRQYRYLILNNKLYYSIAIIPLEKYYSKLLTKLI